MQYKLYQLNSVWNYMFYFKIFKQNVRVYMRLQYYSKKLQTSSNLLHNIGELAEKVPDDECFTRIYWRKPYGIHLRYFSGNHRNSSILLVRIVKWKHTNRPLLSAIIIGHSRVKQIMIKFVRKHVPCNIISQIIEIRILRSEQFNANHSLWPSG